MSIGSGVRADLIEAGLSLLREGGAEALTLRRAAARAGVSHAAPAHHFSGLSGLMTAMGIRAYSAFADAMITERDAAPAGPADKLHAVTRGYLAFAERDSGLFHLLFVAPGINRSDPDLLQASTGAYGVLREACLPFTGGVPDETFEVTIWSMVHGYALLGLSAPDSPKRKLIDIPSFAAMLERFLAAHARG